MNQGVLIIGAGPGGLAVAACLQREGRAAVILEETDQVASSWRRHYQRLHLHTPRDHSSLPHLPMPAAFSSSAVNVIPREIFGIPLLALGLVQRLLSAEAADRLNAPLLCALIGDLTPRAGHLRCALWPRRSDQAWGCYNEGL